MLFKGGTVKRASHRAFRRDPRPVERANDIEVLGSRSIELLIFELMWMPCGNDKVMIIADGEDCFRNPLHAVTRLELVTDGGIFGDVDEIEQIRAVNPTCTRVA